MKAIYNFDNNKIFISSDLIVDGAELPKNATFIQPTDGLRDPIKWNGNEWLGATQEEHDEYHKNDPVEPGNDPTQPTGDDVVHANLFKQALANTAAIQELQSSNKAPTKLSLVNQFANSDMFESLKSWYIMGLLSEADLKASVEQGVITEQQMNEIMGVDTSELP